MKKQIVWISMVLVLILVVTACADGDKPEETLPETLAGTISETELATIPETELETIPETEEEKPLTTIEIKSSENGYTVYFSDETTTSLTVTCGESKFSVGIASIEKSVESSENDTYTVTFADETVCTFSFEPQAEQTVKERVLSSIAVTETKGLTETFTATLADGRNTTFEKVYELPNMDFTGMKMTFLGDSITAGVGASGGKRYTTYLSNLLGLQEYNMGISGTVLCTDGHRTSRLPDVMSIPQDSQFVSILLGINDFDNCRNNEKAVYYMLGDMESRDTSTIYGALHAYCQSLKKRLDLDKTMVFFMTPVATSWNNSVGPEHDWDQSKKNACGYTLRDLCDAIIEVCEYYDILCLDLNAETNLVKRHFSDGIHPNDFGSRVIAETMEKFIKEQYYLTMMD